jgi:60 kDa SS-A/Ro ribonucleoprotein
VDEWDRLDRFLILGSEGGSYYASERKLTRENAKHILKLIEKDGTRVVKRIVEVSDEGRAPKNDPAIFALALAAKLGSAETRRAAYQELPKVCRTGTHLLHFASYCNELGGWGRGLRKAVSDWYNGKSAEKAAYQAIKYQSRDGWSQRDLLRLAHPTAKTTAHNAVFRYVTKGELFPDVPEIIEIFEKAKTADVKDVIGYIREYGLPRECIPTEHLKNPAVWDALLDKMPMTAMIRNLGNMSKCGLLKPLSKAAKTVVERLNNEQMLKEARIHPLGALAALRTYGQGHGTLGKGTWEVVGTVTDALNDAFYKSFKYVEPSGSRMLLGLDVSGSMDGGSVAGVAGITPREASAAMALVTANTEKQHAFMAFTDRFVPIDISPRWRLNQVIEKTSRLPFGRTDCALPMIWALTNKVEVDTFVVYTDSETWAGNVHPVQALAKYRKESGIPAKLVVVGMVSNGFSIADPNDRGMMDVVGFDTAAPQIISEFSKPVT